MSKEKESRQKLHIDIRLREVEKLDFLAEQMDLTRTDVIRLALYEWLNTKIQE